MGAATVCAPLLCFYHFIELPSNLPSQSIVLGICSASGYDILFYHKFTILAAASGIDHLLACYGDQAYQTKQNTRSHLARIEDYRSFSNPSHGN